jgi:hypothetical protein
LSIDVVDDAMDLDEVARTERLRTFTESLNRQLAEMSTKV